VKYSSIHVPIASIRIKLRIFPTPRYKRIENKVKEIEVTRPRLELAKMSEKVNSVAVKNVTKKRKTTPKVCVSTK
jgi:hypothetical protein